MRPMLENGPPSAFFAHSISCLPSTPGIFAGKPMPICMSLRLILFSSSYDVHENSCDARETFPSHRWFLSDCNRNLFLATPRKVDRLTPRPPSTSSFVWLGLYRKWVDHPEHDMWFARGGGNTKTQRPITTPGWRQPHPPDQPLPTFLHTSLPQ